MRFKKDHIPLTNTDEVMDVVEYMENNEKTSRHLHPIGDPVQHRRMGLVRDSVGSDSEIDWEPNTIGKHFKTISK